jgi:hypothetical protein
MAFFFLFCCSALQRSQKGDAVTFFFFTFASSSFSL